MSSYEINLFRAAFSLAFWGFLHIGEIASKSQTLVIPDICKFNDIDIIRVQMKMDVVK